MQAHGGVEKGTQHFFLKPEERGHFQNAGIGGTVIQDLFFHETDSFEI
jgi:hypothetical protein